MRYFEKTCLGKNSYKQSIIDFGKNNNLTNNELLGLFHVIDYFYDVDLYIFSNNPKEFLSNFIKRYLRKDSSNMITVQKLLEKYIKTKIVDLNIFCGFIEKLKDINYENNIFVEPNLSECNIFILSDSHGCLAEFKNSLKVLNGNRNYTLIFNGDATDRGDEGIEILKEIFALPNSIYIFGNHEFDLLSGNYNRYINNEGKGGKCTFYWLYFQVIIGLLNGKIKACHSLNFEHTDITIQHAFFDLSTSLEILNIAARNNMQEYSKDDYSVFLDKIFKDECSHQELFAYFLNQYNVSSKLYCDAANNFFLTMIEELLKEYKLSTESFLKDYGKYWGADHKSLSLQDIEKDINNQPFFKALGKKIESIYDNMFTRYCNLKEYKQPISYIECGITKQQIFVFGHDPMELILSYKKKKSIERINRVGNFLLKDGGMYFIDSGFLSSTCTLSAFGENKLVKHSVIYAIDSNGKSIYELSVNPVTKRNSVIQIPFDNENYLSINSFLVKRHETPSM